MSERADGWIVAWAILLSASVYIGVDEWGSIILLICAVISILASREGDSHK